MQKQDRCFAEDMNEVKLLKLAFEISPGLNVTFTTFSLNTLNLALEFTWKMA